MSSTIKNIGIGNGWHDLPKSIFDFMGTQMGKLNGKKLVNRATIEQEEIEITEVKGCTLNFAFFACDAPRNCVGLRALPITLFNDLITKGHSDFMGGDWQLIEPKNEQLP